MRKVFFAGATVMVLATAVGLAGCSSSPSAAATAAARKTAFCGANIRIDKATVNANSVAAFVAVLKVHKSDLTTMGKNLPAGTLGTEAKQQVAAGKAAIVSGNANDLQKHTAIGKWGHRHVLRSHRKGRPAACLLRDGQGKHLLPRLRPHL